MVNEIDRNRARPCELYIFLWHLFFEKGNVVDETRLDFSEADDMLPQEKLLIELEKTAIHR